MSPRTKDLILWLVVLAIAAIFILFLWFIAAPAAHAGPAEDSAAIRSILSAAHSPLPSWTIEAFALSHPDFSIAGYLAIVNAESSLGCACDYKNNPGSIKGGTPGKPWRDLRIGVSPRGYNIYRTLYDGQRAAILAIYQNYNRALREHDWYAVGRWFGHGVPGYYHWLANVKASMARYERVAAACGSEW